MRPEILKAEAATQIKSKSNYAKPNFNYWHGYTNVYNSIVGRGRTKNVLERVKLMVAQNLARNLMVLSALLRGIALHIRVHRTQSERYNCTASWGCKIR